MRRYWYRRILIMVLVFTISVGGSWYLIEESRAGLEREASAAASEELLIPGGNTKLQWREPDMWDYRLPHCYLSIMRLWLWISYRRRWS